MGNRPTDTTHTFFSVPNTPNINELTHQESMGCEEFLGDSSGNLKTYVHRRNKKLSTVLNIIVLGSVITAAGVAIGHMWGVRDDCVQPTTPSVNKILSNLYKLQEENTYLRNKLKDLTLANNLQIHQRKNDIDKPIAFKNKCKKVFEESLNNKYALKSTKCVESEDFEKTLHDHLTEPAFEQDFVTDLNKLKTFYKQNKSWLDVEVAKRLKDDELSYRAMKQTMKANRINDKKVRTENPKLIPKPLDPPTDSVPSEQKEVTDQIDPTKSKIVSYADSLKADNPKEHKVAKRSFENNSARINIVRRKRPKEASERVLDYISDDEIMKDNRFTEHKQKSERKKHDRYKSHKKLKSKNKYEQWQMKGGIMKDYDDLSVTTSQETFVSENDKTPTKEQIKPVTYSKEVTKEDLHHPPTGDKMKIKRNKDKLKGEMNWGEDWYDKRVFQRMEARRKLDREMFGDNSPNNAGWYFRRMRKREQCRATPDNSTYRKVTKRKMNFKTKH